jgi:predicted transcriptional regulator
VDGDATRQKILDTIEAYGAIHKSGLQQALGVGWGTIGHHLPILSKGQLIQTHESNGKTWLVQPTLSGWELEYCKLFSSDFRMEIASQIDKSEHCTIQSLSESMNRSQKIIRTNLAKMESAVAVETTGQRPKKYALAQTTKSFLATRYWMRQWLER